MATNIIERLFIEVGLDFSKLATEADKAIAKGNKLEESLSKTEDASGKANKALGDLVKSKAKAATGAENLAKGFGLFDIDLKYGALLGVIRGREPYRTNALRTACSLSRL